LPRTTSQQSPGVLCCATSLSEKPQPARTTGGSLRCDALLPSGGMLVLQDVWRASRLASCTGCQRSSRTIAMRGARGDLPKARKAQVSTCCLIFKTARAMHRMAKRLRATRK
jgi:hypothetical protein